MATLREVARMSGVDASTASRVLSGRDVRVAKDTRRRIEAAAEALGYSPDATARGLRLQRKGAIAMAVADPAHYVFQEALRGAEEEAERRGVSLYLLKQPEESRSSRLLAIVREERMDGWIFSDTMPSRVFLEELQSLGIHYITLDRLSAGPGHHVCLDDEAGFREQARAIVALGHRKVAFVTTSPESFVIKLCRHSFLKGMSEMYLPVSPSHVLTSRFSGSEVDLLVESVLALRPRPTAIACASDAVAVRLIERLAVRGIRVPDDIGVVGYHDSPLAAITHPALSTIRMPVSEQGRQAVQRLINLVDGSLDGFPGEIVQARPEFVMRESILSIS